MVSHEKAHLLPSKDGASDVIAVVKVFRWSGVEKPGRSIRLIQPAMVDDKVLIPASDIYVSGTEGLEALRTAIDEALNS